LPPDLHSFPTRRSSDLGGRTIGRVATTRSECRVKDSASAQSARCLCRTDRASDYNLKSAWTARESPNCWPRSWSVHCLNRSWNRSEEHTSELQSPCNLV